MRTLRLLAAAACAAALVFPACHYSNPHGTQALPPVKRVDTLPYGATVRIPHLNLELEAPCDLPETVDEDDEVVISKDGFALYRGPLRALPQPARGTYRCVLQLR